PAPRAIKPRRRKKLWFVPMSAAAVLVGLLVVSVTELGNIGPWRRNRELARREGFGLWDGGVKPYVTGSYFSDLSGAKKFAKRANERTSVEIAGGDSKGVFAGESASKSLRERLFAQPSAQTDVAD